MKDPQKTAKKKKEGKLPHSYIDDLPYLIYERKVICPACGNSYQAPITIDHDRQTECISICPKCDNKFYISYDKEIYKILRKRLRHYKCTSIEQLRVFLKINVGWEKLFYPGYFWEVYERDVLPFYKTREEKRVIIQKHDEEARKGIDYDDFLLVYYYKGNVEDPMVLQTRNGMPYTMDGENIQGEVGKCYCRIMRRNDEWDKHSIRMKKMFVNSILSFQNTNPGSLYKTNIRLIYLRYPNIRAEGPHHPGLPPLIDNNWTAAIYRDNLGWKEGFSIPIKYIVGCIKKRRKAEIYFKNRNNEKFRLTMWQKDGDYDILKAFPLVHNKKELPLD